MATSAAGRQRGTRDPSFQSLVMDGQPETMLIGAVLELEEPDVVEIRQLENPVVGSTTMRGVEQGGREAALEQGATPGGLGPSVFDGCVRC